MNIYDQARQKYLPKSVRVLFVAEAPPENINRFFYQENVSTQDALFISIMRMLYTELRSENGGSVKKMRENKADILTRFQADGYYLVDALPEPISLKTKPRDRKKLIANRKSEVVDKIRGLSPEVGVVLIKATVFDALYVHLSVDQKLSVLNQSSVPFPSHGHIVEFNEQIHRALTTVDTAYRQRTKFTSYAGDIEVIEGSG